MAGPKRHGFRTVFLWASPPLIALALGIVLFSSAGRDDTHISLWPALTVAQTGRYLNYNGEPVEQGSSLAQVLILAGLKKLSGMDIITLGYLLSIAAGLLTVVFAMKLSRSIAPGGWFVSGLLAGSSTYLLYWSFGGLETSLHALLALVVIMSLSGFLVAARTTPKSTLKLAAAALVFSISRPESGIVLLCLLSGIFLFFLVKGRDGGESSRRVIGPAVKRTAAAALLVAGGLGGLALLRLAYFHSFFPQPVVAKASAALSYRRILRGARYLAYSAGWGPAVLILVAAAALAGGFLLWTEIGKRTPRVPLLLSFLFIFVQLSFVLLAGGDWMEGGRFLVPIVPLISILLSLGLSAIIKRKNAARIAAASLLVLQLGISLDFAVRKSTGLPLRTAWRCYRSFSSDPGADHANWFELTNQVHLRDIAVIRELGKLLPRLRGAPTGVTMASTFMGMVPFHLARDLGPGSVRFIDINGLTDRLLTGCPVTADLPRDAFGLEFSLKKFLLLGADLSRTCGVPRADILYGAFQSPTELDLYRAAGYEIVFIQDAYARDLIPERFRRPQPKVFLGVQRDLL